MMKELELDEKIGEGHFRECFAVKSEPGLCVKKLKPNLTILQKLHLNILRRKMNQDEYKIFSKLPEALKPYFNPVIRADRDYLVTKRLMDYDGTHSLPVSDYGKVSNKRFWEEAEKVVALFEAHNLWFFDAFQLGTNVFVQRLSEDHWRPVIVDYKRHGWRSYPAQLNLLCNSEKKKKFYRKYERFVDLFSEPGHPSPKKAKPLPSFLDGAFEWFYRFAASGGVPASWFGPDYSTLPAKAPTRSPLHLEIVSHCWNYANILTYQLSSLVLFPPKETVVCMTVYYEPGDKRTRKVLDYFKKQQVENVHWNFCPLQKEYLLRRAIGRNLAARNTNADWIFFTDCDVLFREQSIDQLSHQLQDQQNLLVYPRFHMVSELLPNEDELFTDFTQAGMIRDIDPERFYREERTRAVGGFQIARGDAARLGGYCGDISYYHRPVKRWRKCYEDRTFRWLLGTQGTAVEVPGFYRIRHAEKGRKGKAVGGQ